MFGWLGSAERKHYEDEITWLRAELRYQRDERTRLQDQFLTLKVGAMVHTTAPSVPRETDLEKDRQAIAEAARLVDEVAVGAVSL